MLLRIMFIHKKTYALNICMYITYGPFAMKGNAISTHTFLTIFPHPLLIFLKFIAFIFCSAAKTNIALQC